MAVFIVRLIAAWALIIAAACPARAQDQDPPLRVATFALEPFVVEDDGALSGFGIELWNDIASRLGIETRYQLAPDVTAVFQSLRNGEADAAVSGLFYSAERDREFDFSYPIIQAGLRIMVRDTGEVATPDWLQGFLYLLFSRASLAWLGIALLLVVVAAHLVWVLEYLAKDGPIPREKYFPGIFRAMYWAATTLMAQGDHTPRQWLARTLTVLWMFVGIIFVASYTAQLTTMLTVQRIQGAINGPDDLSGKRVATLAGSSVVAYLRQHNAQVREFPQNSQVYQALLAGKVDAVVQGSAGLDYYATHEGRGRVRMAGPEFNENGAGFAFPLGSPLRKRVDGALLAMREDGTYQRIYAKWFGTK